MTKARVAGPGPHAGAVIRSAVFDKLDTVARPAHIGDHDLRTINPCDAFDDLGGTGRFGGHFKVQHVPEKGDAPVKV